jgi:iron complex outermembrane receptor protein
MNTFNKATLTTAILTVLYGYTPSPIYAAEPEESAKELESVAVFGKGETRQVSGINSADIGDSAAGSSPLKVLGKLPGVNFNSADSLGAYEWGSRISMRGFAQNQLGFTLDDVPLGDMSYRNYNGLHISRAITSENLGKVAVSQGTGALGTASNSN